METLKKLLEENAIPYEEKDGKIIVNGGHVDLYSLTTLPEGTVFNNGGYVYLRSLIILPEGAVFNNGGYVDLRSLTTLPEGTVFNNGGDVNLYSLTTLPEGTVFNNGGYVYLRSLTLKGKSFFDLFVRDDKVIIFKRVSANFETQEETRNRTEWLPGTTVVHPNWNPEKEECGEGKFHGCPKPWWCDMFRDKRSDRDVAVLVKKEDIYEWPDSKSYPQKIAFREGRVLYEVDRNGNKI